MSNHASILLIDDSPGECELFRQALAQAALDVALYTEHDGDAALHFLTNRRGHETLPSLILLDWHLEKVRGDRFLTSLRSSSRFASIPVVVFTTSDVTSDLAAGYASGANGYVVKPGTFDELVQCVGVMCRFWTTWNVTPYPMEITC
jgi:DNA-binding response OmpR family regulator